MKIVVFGDSVAWGQGLLAAEKFHSLVGSALNGGQDGNDCTLFAHSGATIGARASTAQPPIDGEVPVASPTILQQCAAFADSPDTVDVVILNGGINDIDVRTILDPFTSTSDLTGMILQHCYQDTLLLVGQVTHIFTNPNTKIVLTGYYPILSSRSDLVLLPPFLHLHGVQLTDLLTDLSDLVFDKIIRHCLLFWQQSSQMFNRVVTETNNQAGNARVLYAQAPFTEDNAALAPQSWLWGVNPDLSPQDPVSDQRQAACDRCEPDPILRETCYRASAGHPNVEGARQFAQAILQTLQPGP